MLYYKSFGDMIDSPYTAISEIKCIKKIVMEFGIEKAVEDLEELEKFIMLIENKSNELAIFLDSVARPVEKFNSSKMSEDVSKRIIEKYYKEKTT